MGIIWFFPLLFRENPFALSQKSLTFATETIKQSVKPSKKTTIMKKMMLTLIAMLTIAVSANAMPYDQARAQALFLTDKMAYELNLTDAQYEAAYEINLDYLMSVATVDDVFSMYWERRNLDLSYILFSWQWDMFRAATYFYRPLYWDAGYWHFRIYARYPHRSYYYFGSPHFYHSYRGGHSWRVNGGRSFYEGHRDHYRPNHISRDNHSGMRDGWDRGDYSRNHNSNRSSTRVTGSRENNHNNGNVNDRNYERNNGSMGNHNNDNRNDRRAGSTGSSRYDNSNMRRVDGSSTQRIENNPQQRVNTTLVQRMDNTTPVQRSNTTPVQRSNSTPTQRMNSTPVQRSNSAPATRSYSAPATRSYSAPATRSNSTPAMRSSSAHTRSGSMSSSSSRGSSSSSGNYSRGGSGRSGSRR